MRLLSQSATPILSYEYDIITVITAMQTSLSQYQTNQV